jgi:cell division septal protein FtsQ
MMAKKALLSNQSVSRKRTESRRPFFGDLLRFVTSVSFKVSILIVGMISVSLLFVYLYKALVNSSYLKLRSVQVTGVDDGMKRQIIMMAGLNENLSLLTLNPNEIKAKIEKHPWVRSVELEKQFPHTLIIKAEKESPRALVLFDKFFYMNRWGKVFKELDEGENTDFPVITGVSKTADNADEKLALAAGILDSFASETGLLSLDDISEIHVNDGGDALIYSISLPVAVRMGMKDLEKGKSRLKKLVRHLQGSSVIDTVKVIDMNYLDGAVVSFKKQDSSSPPAEEGDLTVGL